MKNNLLTLFLAIAVLVVLVGTMVLALSYYHVAVVDGTWHEPIGRAWVTVRLASGQVMDMGKADEAGELRFWIVPWKFPRRICAAYLFFPPNCVKAFGMFRQWIELAVP